MGTDYLSDDQFRKALAQRQYHALGGVGGLFGVNGGLQQQMAELHDHYLRDRGTPIAIKKVLTAREELQEEADNFLKF